MDSKKVSQQLNTKTGIQQLQPPSDFIAPSPPLSSSLSPCPSLAENETEPGASDRQATWRSVTGSELQNPNVASDKANYTATCLLFNLCQQSAEELWIGQHKNKASGQQIDIVNGPNGTVVPRRAIRVEPGSIARTRIRTTTRTRSRSRSVEAFIEAKQNAEGCQGGGRTTLRCRQAQGKQLLPKLYSICFVFHAACSSSSLVSFFPNYLWQVAASFMVSSLNAQDSKNST